MTIDFDNPMQPDGMAAGPLSLLEFARRISSAVNTNPGLRGAWVVAELSDLNRHPTGHCYMELIQKDEQTGRTIARMRATIWRSALLSIDRKFFTATGRQLSGGMKVMLRLDASHHELYGMSANITDVDPSYTLGDMERLRREILEKLRREGVLGLNKTLQVPVNPQRIAVISAAGAAGYGDFVNQLGASAEGFKFYPLLFPAAMQGLSTSASVREALARIEMSVDFWDCVVIIRGGGATTDLNGFDDYELARAVATYPLPIIVGIGHERDRTVLDEIACVRCKTPTAVAGYLIDCMRFAEHVADEAGATIVHLVRDRLAGQHERLARASALIPEIPRRRLEAESRRLDSLRDMLVASSRGKTQSGLQYLQNIPAMLKAAVASRINLAGSRLESLTQLVNVLSPDNTLRRGYSITRVGGKAVRSIADVKEGDIVETTLLDGTLRSLAKCGK